jgi:hypothetical protein
MLSAKRIDPSMRKMFSLHRNYLIIQLTYTHAGVGDAETHKVAFPEANKKLI